MCLIIQRKPNFEIPYQKFETAILNNPDGYGLSYPVQDGRLITLRSADKPDPEELYRLVNEELLEQDLMVHLRYTTVGDTILRNAHPFPILERDKDGIDLRMSHNGTLHKYRPDARSGSTESDTRVFVREFVRPLFKRLARGMEPEELLSDDFTKKLLEDKLTTMSVLTFLDGNGNSLICNEEGNGGKKEEKWYYSNTYSFDPKHRVKPTYNNYQSSTYGTPSNNVVPYTGGGKFKDSNVQKFTKKYDLTDITDTFHFNDDIIEKLCQTRQTDAVLLIKELIYELQQANREVQILEKKKGTKR